AEDNTAPGLQGAAGIVPCPAVAGIEVCVEARVLSIGLDAGAPVIVRVHVCQPYVAVGVGAVPATDNDSQVAKTAHIHLADADEFQQARRSTAVIVELDAGVLVARAAGADEIEVADNQSGAVVGVETVGGAAVNRRAPGAVRADLNRVPCEPAGERTEVNGAGKGHAPLEKQLVARVKALIVGATDCLPGRCRRSPCVCVLPGRTNVIDLGAANARREANNQ